MWRVFVDGYSLLILGQFVSSIFRFQIELESAIKFHSLVHIIDIEEAILSAVFLHRLLHHASAFCQLDLGHINVELLLLLQNVWPRG